MDELPSARLHSAAPRKRLAAHLRHGLRRTAPVLHRLWTISLGCVVVLYVLSRLWSLTQVKYDSPGKPTYVQFDLMDPGQLEASFKKLQSIELPRPPLPAHRAPPPPATSLGR